MLTSRPATPADFTKTLAIKKQALGPYISQVWGWDEQEQLVYHQTHFRPEGMAILLCDGQEAGLLETSHTPESLHVLNLLLLPAFQGRGLGTQILKQLLQQAASAGQAVLLEVLKVNARALALYQRLGFTIRDTSELKIRMIFPLPMKSDKPLNLLLLGSGAREHALYDKLTRDGATVHVVPGNAGIPNSHPEVNPLDFEQVKAFAQAHDVRLIVVGPEAPLAAGIADFFAGSDIRVFGPTRAAATLESSKVWSKDFMRRHGVATALAWPYRSDRIAEARAKAAELKGQVVIKYDGLAAGKGVYVCSSVAEAEAALDELQSLHGGWFSFLLEEKLLGPEISIITITDSHAIKLLAPSQDHKQLYANDLGPNTGGMGAYCPVPFADGNVLAAIRRDIIDPTLRGLQTEQFDFKGFLYFGIMLTPSGPKLLEYNVRLGDPEAEVLLPALESSLLEVIEATLDGTLAQKVVRQRPGAFVGVVLTSGGYPAAKFPTGFPITGLDKLPPDTVVYHGATKRDASGQLVTNGGRVLVAVGHGPDLEIATERAYAASAQIDFQDKYVRPDIAQRPEPVLTESVVN